MCNAIRRELPRDPPRRRGPEQARAGPKRSQDCPGRMDGCGKAKRFLYNGAYIQPKLKIHRFTKAWMMFDKYKPKLYSSPSGRSLRVM